MRFNTGLLHGNSVTRNTHGETLPPISQVSAFRYDSMEELEQVFQHKRMGFAYTRIGNPTISAQRNGGHHRGDPRDLPERG